MKMNDKKPVLVQGMVVQSAGGIAIHGTYHILRDGGEREGLTAYLEVDDTVCEDPEDLEVVEILYNPRSEES